MILVIYRSWAAGISTNTGNLTQVANFVCHAWQRDPYGVTGWRVSCHAAPKGLPLGNGPQADIDPILWTLS